MQRVDLLYLNNQQVDLNNFQFSNIEIFSRKLLPTHNILYRDFFLSEIEIFDFREIRKFEKLQIQNFRGFPGQIFEKKIFKFTKTWIP